MAIIETLNVGEMMVGVGFMPIGETAEAEEIERLANEKKEGFVDADEIKRDIERHKFVDPFGATALSTEVESPANSDN